MIWSYSEYNINMILESLNESIVYFSPNFKRKLNKIDDDISNRLLDIEGRDLRHVDVTFIDSDDEGNVSFISMNNAEKWLEEDSCLKLKDIPDVAIADYLYDTGSLVYKKSRNDIKLGRLIRKLFTDHFNDNQIEMFVNKFKAVSHLPSEKIQIVSGESIRKWYRIDSLYRISGTLGSSCMNDELDFLDIYCDNPSTCKMVIITLDDKLIARALLWKLRSVSGMPKVDMFMDRVYSIWDKDVVRLVEFAKNEGFAHRYFTSSYESNVVSYNSNIYNEVSMSVNVRAKSYDKYPYLDTFKRFQHDRGLLWNDTNIYKGGHILDDTYGGYRPSLTNKQRLMYRLLGRFR